RGEHGVDGGAGVDVRGPGPLEGPPEDLVPGREALLGHGRAVEGLVQQHGTVQALRVVVHLAARVAAVEAARVGAPVRQDLLAALRRHVRQVLRPDRLEGHREGALGVDERVVDVEQHTLDHATTPSARGPAAGAGRSSAGTSTAGRRLRAHHSSTAAVTTVPAMLTTPSAGATSVTSSESARPSYAMAKPNATRLFAACMATASSRPPVRHTSTLATRPNTSRSANSHGFCEPCAIANSTAVTTAGSTSAARRHRSRLPSHCVAQPRKKYSSPAACSGVVSSTTTASASQLAAGVRGQSASSPPAGSLPSPRPDTRRLPASVSGSRSTRDSPRPPRSSRHRTRPTTDVTRPGRPACTRVARIAAGMPSASARLVSSMPAGLTRN